MLFVFPNLALAALATVFHWSHLNHPFLIWLTLLCITCLGLLVNRSFEIGKRPPPEESIPVIARTLAILLAALWGGQAFLIPLTAPGVLSFHSPTLILLGILFTLGLSSCPVSAVLALFLLLSPTLYLLLSGEGLLLQPAQAISLFGLFLLAALFLRPFSFPMLSPPQPARQNHLEPSPRSPSFPSSTRHCFSSDTLILESILKLTSPGAPHCDWQRCFKEIHSAINNTLQADNFFLLERRSTTAASLVSQEKEPINPPRHIWILSVQIWTALLSKGAIVHNLAENFMEEEHKTLARDGIKTLLLIPLIVKNELWGVIGLDRRKSSTLFTQQQINFLRFIANILAMSISNQRDRWERDRLATVVEQSSDCIIITNTKGRILYANPACKKVTGYLPEEILGKSVKILHAPSIRQDLWNQIKEAIINGDGWNGQFANYRKDKTLYEEEMLISPVHDHEGRITNRVIVKRNITEEKRLESIAEAANLMDNIGFVFSSIRHELGNPINSIKVSLSVLDSNLENYTTADIKRFISRSLSDIGRVEYLLKTLKNFSVFEQPHIEATDLLALLTKLVQLTEKDLKKQEVTLKIDHPPQPLIGLVDPRAFLQVLLNLITNAVAALDGCKNKEISITMAGGKNEQITFSLEDNGCGMEDETIRNLFRPFFTTKPEGTGLGLVIVKKMLSKMNCSIEASSRKNRGTRIQIIIPVG